MFIYSRFDFIIEFPGKHYLRSKTSLSKSKSPIVAVGFSSIESAHKFASDKLISSPENSIYKVRNRTIHLEE